MSETTDCDVLIIGGGVAGRSASIFTARHDFETAIIDGGHSLLRRNAHLENYPGFPAGVNSRLLLELMADHAERAGAAFQKGHVTTLDQTAAGFRAETDTGHTYNSDYVIAATKNTVDYLAPIDGVDIIHRGSKAFVDTDERGRTGVAGLYAAGRLAMEPHQTIIAAGHGAKVAVTLLEDASEPFYHDWVAPDRYFTGRDRAIPPGVEEIAETERRARERKARDVLRDALVEPHPETPEQHPSVDPPDGTENSE